MCAAIGVRTSTGPVGSRSVRARRTSTRSSPVGSRRSPRPPRTSSRTRRPRGPRAGPAGAASISRPSPRSSPTAARTIRPPRLGHHGQSLQHARSSFERGVHQLQGAGAGFDLRQEPEPADLDPQDGTVGLARDAPLAGTSRRHRPRRRAPADRRGRRPARGRGRSGIPSASSSLRSPSAVDTALSRPSCTTNATRVTAPPRPTRGPSRTSRGRRSPPTTAWTRNSALPAGPRTGETITPAGSAPAACDASATSSIARRQTSGSRTTPAGTDVGPAPRTAA